jgi:hypothetical protein
MGEARLSVEAGFTPAEAGHPLVRETARRRELAGEPWVPRRSNICRCTGYVNIVEAVVDVGRRA